MAAHPVEITRLTAAGSGAVAVLRLEGEDLLPLLGRHLLTPGGRPITEERLAQEADSARHRPIFVHIPLTNTAARDAADRPREEAVLYLPSRTTAELSCHGGDLLVESVISLFLADGAAAASGAFFSLSSTSAMVLFLPLRGFKLQNQMITQFHPKSVSNWLQSAFLSVGRKH